MILSASPPKKGKRFQNTGKDAVFRIDEVRFGSRLAQKLVVRIDGLEMIESAWVSILTLFTLGTLATGAFAVGEPPPPWPLQSKGIAKMHVREAIPGHNSSYTL